MWSVCLGLVPHMRPLWWSCGWRGGGGDGCWGRAMCGWLVSKWHHIAGLPGDEGSVCQPCREAPITASSRAFTHYGEWTGDRSELCYCCLRGEKWKPHRIVYLAVQANDENSLDTQCSHQSLSWWRGTHSHPPPHQSGAWLYMIDKKAAETGSTAHCDLSSTSLHCFSVCLKDFPVYN